MIPTILITGESGSGKNHLARVIAAHRRWIEVRNTTGDLGLEAGLEAYTDRFAEVHLPALPDQLVESELFGYRRGAFTDATRNRIGLFDSEGREGGFSEILLDEIGDASPGLQAKLLSIIESRKFRPLGAGPDEERSTSARLIIATNRDLALMCTKGQFRRDLLWRLRLFHLAAPPLREQRDNIEAIVRAIESEIKERLPANLDPEGTPSLTDEDIMWAREYSWPGNVRQMKHAITLWLFEEGTRPLQVLARGAEHDPPTGRAARTGGTSLDSLVMARLQGALEDPRRSPGSLQELLGEFADETRAAVVRWLDDTKPSDVDIQRLFPTHKDPKSVRNKLSQWRAK